jgi:hypothetical protein
MKPRPFGLGRGVSSACGTAALNTNKRARSFATQFKLAELIRYTRQRNSKLASRDNAALCDRVRCGCQVRRLMLKKLSSEIANVAKIAMPRGSKPGERHGGRKKGTPNKSTALKKAALSAASADPTISPLQSRRARPGSYTEIDVEGPAPQR